MTLAENARSCWCESAAIATNTASPANVRISAYGVGEGEALCRRRGASNLASVLALGVAPADHPGASSSTRGDRDAWNACAARAG